MKHTTNHTHNIRIKNVIPLPSPTQIKTDFPLTKESWNTTQEARAAIPRILRGESCRFLVIVGPCSVHDEQGIMEYTRRLAPLVKQYNDRLCIVMRTCFDKPRSRMSWLGFFSDWDMSGSRNPLHLLDGWNKARKLLIDITNLGVPTATEYLDAEGYQNVDDLYAYTWVGARNAQTQDYRIVASGLSPACGFKNPTSGLINHAIEAIEFAKHSHVFAAPHDTGVRSGFETTGNADCHLILRGSDSGPNYDPDTIEAAVALLRKHRLIDRILVDASHGNSGKNHFMQEEVIGDVLGQVKIDRARGRTPSIAGIMYESYLEDGNQSIEIPVEREKLKPGVSVTDGCDGWKRTERILEGLYKELAG